MICISFIIHHLRSHTQHDCDKRYLLLWKIASYISSFIYRHLYKFITKSRLAKYLSYKFKTYMQTDIYVDKDYDKVSHIAIKHSETHVFLTFCGHILYGFWAEMHNNFIIYLWFDATEGGGPGTVVKAACLESRWSRVRTPHWPSRKQHVSFFSLIKIQYCGEPLCAHIG